MDFPYDPAAFEKFKKDPSVPELLERFLSELTAIVSWDKHAVENALRDFTEPGGIKAAVVIHPMRLALTGKPAGPGVFELVEAMGKENTIARLQRFVKEVRSAA